MAEKKLTDNDWKLLALKILESDGKDGTKVEEKLHQEGYNKALEDVEQLFEGKGLFPLWNVKNAPSWKALRKASDNINYTKGLKK